MSHKDDLELFTVPPEASHELFLKLEQAIKLIDVSMVVEANEDDAQGMAQVLKYNLSLANVANRLYCQILEAHAKLELRRRQAEGRYSMLVDRIMLTRRFAALGITVRSDKIAKAKEILEQQRKEECAPVVPPDIEDVIAELKALELLWKYLRNAASSTIRVVKQADMIAKKLFGARTPDTGGHVRSTPSPVSQLDDILAAAQLDDDEPGS